MSDAAAPPPVTTRRAHRSAGLPSYVYHPDFDTPAGRRELCPDGVLAAAADFGDRHMPDDVTKDHARRMHYSAHRMHRADRPADLGRWTAAYLALRDRVVLGNRKLIYRAVRRRQAAASRADDMIGDCQVVLIQAVAAFNPWLGIRFSTYAYTCLVRALARQGQRQAADWLTRAMPLDALPDGEPGGRFQPEPGAAGQVPIDEFLRDDHPLLSAREKSILTRRFCLADGPQDQTLEKVGKALGLSKERVRQVQASALGKLRRALAPAPPPAAAADPAAG